MIKLLHISMAVLHSIAGIAFLLEGNPVGATAQLIGAILWLLLISLHEEATQ